MDPMESFQKSVRIIARSIAVLVVAICIVLLVNNTTQIANLFKLLKKDITWKDSDGNTALHSHALSANLRHVNERLVEGADVNAKNLYGDTPLILAAQGGNKDIVEILVFQGADVNAKSASGNTALHWAASKNREEISEFLVSKGANVNAKNDDGKTPLDYNTDVSKNLAEKYRK